MRREDRVTECQTAPDLPGGSVMEIPPQTRGDLVGLTREFPECEDLLQTDDVGVERGELVADQRQPPLPGPLAVPDVEGRAPPPRGIGHGGSAASLRWIGIRSAQTLRRSRRHPVVTPAPAGIWLVR